MAAAAVRRPGAATVAIVLTCLVLFALLAWQVVSDGPLTELDLRVTFWWAAHRQAWLTQAMLLLSDLHETEKLLAAAALVAGWLLWRRQRRAAAQLLVVPAGMLCNVGLKHVFDRLRPTLDEPLVQLTTYSFPSGHAAASTVFYGALCSVALAHLRHPVARALAVAVAAAMALLVCFSRVYLGAHYLSDVTAGLAVGLVWLLLMRRWLGTPAPASAGAACKSP